MAELAINFDAYLELTNIAEGVFQPLTGFMAEADYHGVVRDLRLVSGELWPLPITLDVEKSDIREIENASVVDLLFQGEKVGEITPSGVYQVDPASDSRIVFGSNDPNHPGVAKELSRSPFRVGGSVSILRPYRSDFPEWDLTPAQTRAVFASKGWVRVAGFQTRNPPHLAHEYLQRVAMETSDGVFVHPLIGWKKKGDFTPDAIMGAYEIMMRQFYPGNAVLGTLRTPMRYAGPREALFHAIIRRNHGCTAFIVGRDHAGVGKYYGKYEAQRLAVSLQKELGIEILPLAGPRYCSRCGSVSTERTCSHAPEDISEVSGTEMRRLLSAQTPPHPHFMRSEISSYLMQLSTQGRLFCDENVLKTTAREPAPTKPNLEGTPMDFTIIVTVGPSILSKIDRLIEIQEAGSCIFRLNGAHCSPEQLKIYNSIIKAVIPKAKVMIDLPGNKVRTSKLPNPIRFMRGEAITMSGSDFNYAGFPSLVKPGDTILANDSTLKFIVEKSDKNSIVARAEHSGELIGGKGMHMKGISASLPFLFQADINLIKAAAEAKVDYVSLSYVRNRKDIVLVRNLLKELNYEPTIVAKIETASALENLHEILDEVEKVNIDRGDLSSDIGMLQLSESQDRVISTALGRGKDIFLATQFLKNMETNPVPLIPEMLELANSIGKGISGLQLSEETAVGQYPLECINLVWSVVRHHQNVRHMARDDSISLKIPHRAVA